MCKNEMHKECFEQQEHLLFHIPQKDQGMSLLRIRKEMRSLLLPRDFSRTVKSELAAFLYIATKRSSKITKETSVLQEQILEF